MIVRVHKTGRPERTSALPGGSTAVGPLPPMPVTWRPGMLPTLPADLPAQENDDGLPSPDGSAAPDTAEVGSNNAAATAGAGGAARGGGGGGNSLPSGTDGGSPYYGLVTSLRCLQRQNAEEAAFIRGTLAALKQVTLAGFEDVGEVEVLPGLPRVWSSQGTHGRGALGSVAAAGSSTTATVAFAAAGSTTGGGWSQTSASSIVCPAVPHGHLAFHAATHEANLAAIFGGGGAARWHSPAAAAAALRPFQGFGPAGGAGGGGGGIVSASSPAAWSRPPMSELLGTLPTPSCSSPAAVLAGNALPPSRLCHPHYRDAVNGMPGQIMYGGGGEPAAGPGRFRG
ncbi:hypothetical protein VOLCADRAFT_95683 [Volvox carteri f. nagariensis]|uniref:Uncharacterized protein n=1 Tax=Volvox carteri f. nagariensis TaxID=3068 RepID=D8U842_VOLCA|nr:uncharacterized protein VOLCADRAFT_95683 [Volvox carteri f. nagariensis]EFJ44022.1 hypothetical protein VOLCADRAFT_95683 [Volvox carteri f. nagariensis]|eukprot:XP_002954823.1 hypothetical protein VOLCADRAFT_95683 [Volvox carteri f. nagariensis]